MKNRQISLSVSVLHGTLQAQVNESIKRVDARRSENMMGNVYAQSSSIAKIDQAIIAAEAEVKAATAGMLERADNDAVKEILSAYGEVLQ